MEKQSEDQMEPGEFIRIQGIHSNQTRSRQPQRREDIEAGCFVNLHGLKGRDRAASFHLLVQLTGQRCVLGVRWRSVYGR